MKIDPNVTSPQYTAMGGKLLWIDEAHLVTEY